MKYNDKAVDAVLEFLACGHSCPTIAGLKGFEDENCMIDNCIACWEQALQQEPREDDAK